MRERWAKIRGFKDYMISDHGRVKSLGRMSVDGRRWVEECILSSVMSGRYLFVSLYQDGKQYYKEIHRMVAIAWVTNPKKLPSVNHKDRKRWNNYYKNLEWCTDRENTSYHYLSLNKTSKYIGVHMGQKKKNWTCQIQIDGVKIYIGSFKKEKDAAIMYNNFLKMNDLFNKYSKL